MSLTTQWVRDWISLSAQRLSEHSPTLQKLDEVIGDGDHGKNIALGFAAAEQKLQTIESATPRRALRQVAYILLASVGGAAGSLYGTAFLRAARSLPDTDTLEAQDLALMLVKAAEGVGQLGQAEPGHKTMMDAWYPAATAAALTLSDGGDEIQVLQAAAQAAIQGAEDTISMTASQGRAAALGGQSIGHQDPGALSTAIILQAGADSVHSQRH